MNVSTKFDVNPLSVFFLEMGRNLKHVTEEWMDRRSVHCKNNS